MYQRNSIAWGLLIGAAFPVAGLVVLWIINLIWNRLDPMGMDLPIRERTLLLLVICLNLIPFRRFNQNRKLNSLRGVVTMTVILAFAWIARYFATLMN
ncbi:MAG: hypothetical protein R2787_09790 [Saprospiraceae bacterium]|nr:hypothetical protein [Saprospiraceae bacterium]MCB9313851.1 hypothetical protein [Lewinellaceae bacterium]